MFLSLHIHQRTLEDMLLPPHIFQRTLGDMPQSSHILELPLADITPSSHILKRSLGDMPLHPHILQRSLADMRQSRHILHGALGDMLRSEIGFCLFGLEYTTIRKTGCHNRSTILLVIKYFIARQSTQFCRIKHSVGREDAFFNRGSTLSPVKVLNTSEANIMSAVTMLYSPEV